MPFDDSLIGSNDFDPRTATEDLIRRVTPDAPATLDPRALNTRLARKLGQTPPRAPRNEAPEPDGKPALDFSGQALPASNMEPDSGSSDLDFTSQVTPQTPPAPLGVTGELGALAKGVPTGAVEGVGGVMKGMARATNDVAYPTTARERLAQPFDKFFGRETPPAPPPAPPVEQNPIYRAGQAVEGFHPNMTAQERDSLGGRVGTMMGGIAPYGAAALAGGPAIGIAAGFTGMAADTYGKVYEDAKAKGADDATAQTAAAKSAAAAGMLGSLPLGTGTLAKSIVGKVLSQGVTFASTNEATEYVLQEIAKDYDEKAGYHPEAKRIIASLITGGFLGGLHAFERKRPETRIDSEHDTRGPAPEGLPGPDPTMQGPDEARQRAEREARAHQWGRGPDDGAASAGASAGPEPGPQGGPQPGGARARPEGEQATGEPPKGEGRDIPDDYTMDPKMRAKMERVFRTFDKTGDPSTMTDAELFRAVNEHLRDTSSTGYTAKGDTAEEKAQREQHQTKQAEDAELKAAFPWMKDSQIAAMTPDMREVWLKRARGPKPGEQATGERPRADATEQPETATTSAPDKVASGTREAPIAAKSADDVRAAQPVEPKSAAQAEAENYKHAHMELEHLGLAKEHSISIETGVGQTRKGPPGPDGKPTWEVKMEHGAYGRIKGTKGADGQPLDIMVGPHPQSPYVFILNQHDPKTGQFDELKVHVGYRTPIDAMHAYANSFDDGAHGRIGGMVAMNADQFRAWLKAGNHAQAVQHDDAKSVLARAFPEAGAPDKTATVSSEGGVESIASSPGLLNAGEEARRPLTEAPTELASSDVPKGSREGDAKEATARPASTTTQDRDRSMAGGNISLLEFLADRGGIAPHPELEAIGFGGMHRVQIPGRKGFFGLIKKGGWDLDTAREAAEEVGYIQGDSPDVTSTIRHLLDAMDAEARGNKLYPFQGEGQRTKAEQRTDRERIAHEEEQHRRYYAQAHEEIDAEYPELPRDLRDTAARAMVLDGFDVDTAVEYAAIWEVNRDNELYEQPQHSILETFGPEATDAIQSAAAHGDGAEAGRDREQEDHAGGAEARAGDGRDVQEARAERGEAVEGRAGEGAGRAEAAGEGEPVAATAAVERSAGREQAAGDEAGDTARQEPAAANPDSAEGGVAPRYDYDGATAKVQASDSDETVTVTLSRKGPWDFSETFPAPLPEQLKGLEANGRWPFSDNPANVEEIANTTDAGIYDMMSEIGVVRATDLQIDGIQSGKIKLRGKKKPADHIEELKKDRAKAAESLRQLQGVYEDIFGRDAANAMVKEARKRLVEEDRLAGKAKADEPKKVAEFIKHIEAEIGTGRMDADISPTKSLDTFRAAAEQRGWTYGAYGKGKALWSPDRKHVIFTSVAVDGNHVTAQWGTPSEGITPPGEKPDWAREATPEEQAAIEADLRKPKPSKKAKSVDELTAAEKKAHRDAPTWAQVLAELPMHKDGRTHEHEIAFEIMKEIAPKARQKFDNLTPEQKGELYERVKARKPDLWSVVESADNALSGNAARVIERWVGGPPGAAKAGATHGFFDWKPLEEAMATNGQVAKDIAAAFRPVKERLREQFGNSIKLHRYERAETQPPGRTLYSYTLDQSGMEHYANAPKERPLYTEDEIAALEKTFAEKGEVKIPRSQYSLERQQVGGIDYIAIMDPSVGGEVTDTGSVREFMDERNAIIRKNNEERAEALKGAKTETIPLDQIVWVTDRFHQQEFIVRKPPVTTETGADNKQQTVIPGAEKASDKTMAQRKAEAPLKPKANQQPADIGLFGDERNQTDMFSTPGKVAKNANNPPRDEFDDIFDAAVNEQFAKPVSLDQATEGLKAIFGKKAGLEQPKKPFSDRVVWRSLDDTVPPSYGTIVSRKGSIVEVQWDDGEEGETETYDLNNAASGIREVKPTGLAESEAPFSDDTYAQALPFLKAGTASFASAGDLTAMVRALVSHLANSGMDADAIRAMKPYIRRFTDDVRSGKETLNAPSRREVLERDRSNAAPENGVGTADVPAAAGAARRGAGARGAEANAGEQRPAGGERLPQDYAPVVGERGHLEIPEREPVDDGSDAADAEPARGADGGEEGFSFDDRADAEAEADAQRDADLNARRERQRQADAKRIPLKHGDLENIAATLPMLFPEQHADVKAAEDRFAKANGHGMLFTNGTGTGKTYSGLGIIKRFALAGKKQTIVIAPSQGILMDWQRSARDLGLEMHILDSTVDKGRPGLNGTTYANFGDNAHLVDHEWDLIVPDEAHKLSSDQDGTTTKALRTLRALTMHPDGLHRRAEMVLRDLFDKIPTLGKKPTAEENARHSAAVKAYNDKAQPLLEKWKGEKRQNKAAFLSATPFAYHFSLDWAEGYLFDFPEDKNPGAYNAPTGRDQFYIQHLGYRKRIGKLTKPDAEVKQEVMERELHEYLKRQGSLAGRMLTVDKDYDRKFILAHDAVGNQIDQALNFLQDNEQFRPLVDYVAKRFDYLTRMRLLEAIKARAAIDYINQSLALGRKVVVFHDYNEGGGINPFDLDFAPDAKTTTYSNGKHEEIKLKPLYEEFIRQNPYVKDLKFSDYGPPIETLTAAFPKALVYNGTVPKKKRDSAKALFNDDNSGRDIIIVQSAAGEAGISLHDTTGKHQRVTLNLGMPIRPVSSIQQEGRIYRVGQASDALFRYMNTGTDWERWTFAGKIADRAGTAENLALGNQARTIRQAFIDAFSNADDYRPEPGEGTGGKAADRAVTHSMSAFEKAKTHYYAQQKNNAKRQNREGTDYYATPEPLGLKMVEWANVKSGEKILEPSAGHGAIARYFPEDTHRTLVEPSSSLASRAALNSPGARVVASSFESLDTGANKFDAIVMNPPFGHGGATAIEHLAKAAKHLKNGGRIVALIPRGSTDGKFDKFMDSPAAKDIYQVADINLPPVTFERAGTSISARVVVLEKQADKDVVAKMDGQRSRDYSGAQTIGELFDAIEHSELPPRLEPVTKDVETPAQGRITVSGIEFDIVDDSKRNPDNPTFYASPRNKFRDRFRTVVGYAEKVGGRYSTPSFEFKTAEQRQAFLDMLANPPKEAEAPSTPAGVTFKTAETIHGKTGAKVYVAVPEQRVERDVYNQMNTTAKAFGGFYSSFKGGKAIPGFQFTSDENRAKFLAKMGGKVDLGEPEAPAGSAQPNQIDTSSFSSHLEGFQRSRGPRQGGAAQDFTLQMGRRTGNEWLAAVGPDGRVLAAYEGTRASISFTPEFEKLARTPGADIVAHHNHPSGRGLSAPDVSILAMPGISAVWAHGHNGNIYRVALTPEAKKALPADVDQARVKLYKLWNAVGDNLAKMMEPAVISGAVSVDDANMAHGQLVMEMLRDAGVVDYQTNTDPVGLIPQVPNLDKFIERALPHVTADLFGSKTAPNRNDRRARPLRHTGDVGASFDRIALLPTVGSSRGNDRARGENGRYQAGIDKGVGGDQPRLLDAPPGLEDLDKTFNDLLGKRLLGRLGDLNATEMRVQLQDKFARVRNVEQDKGNTNTALSAYQAESLYYGRTGQRLESLKEHQIDPIIREMRGRSIDLDSMDKFLYARHAPERNNVVGALYPDGHEFKRATTDPRVKGASGMSTGEANSYIGRLRASGKLPDYEAVARMVDALNFRTRQTLYRGGLIDRETFDALNSQYRYYVPLRGWQEGSNEAPLPHQGKGMDTRARAFKQAFGRQSIAASPLAYSIMQAEQAIVRAEKNKVGNTFVRFARANPDPDLWTINRPTPRKMISKATGMVHNTPTWDMNKDNVFVTRIDGKATLVEFKGEDGVNLARALKNMGTANIHSAVRMMAAVTHTMARLATAWNPEFMIPNLVRDVGEAFINLGEQRQRTFVRKFAGHILPAMKGSWLAIADKSAAPGSSAQAYIDAFHEFDREGGRVRFFGIDDPDVIEKNVEKRLKRLSGGVVNSIKDLGEKAGKAMEIMGGGIENATRLAAYMAAKEVGMTAPDAAMLARNLTVNFNKKGELGTAIGSLYMFANAGVQGQARMLRALHPKNRRVWLAIGALVAANIAATAFNMGIGGYDDAGKANYLKIPSWERDKNIIIMGPGETYGKIPLPYGFSPFAVLGSHMTTVLMGQEKPTAAAAAVFGSIASAFNPLGEEESVIGTLMPTPLRPAMHIHFNENWTGRPLYPARDADKGKPESQQSFRTDTAASKYVAEKLNELSGGDRYRPGMIDIHPGSIDHVMGAITGGVGKFAKNVVDTIMNGWNGKEWEASKTPILRRFVGKLDHNMADSAAYYEARKEATEEANRVRQAKRDIKTGANEEEARAYLEATPAGRQKLIFDRADQQMRRLRAEEERINNSPQPYEAKKAALDALRLQMRDVQNRARAESARLKGQKP